MLEKWSNEKIRYNERLDAVYFDSEAEKEEAVYVVDVPENAESFSVTIKVGDSEDFNIKGYQDAGRITVGYGDGSEKGKFVTSSMISQKKGFVNLSLGSENIPISTDGADKLYIKSEARNFDGGKIDFYFCEPVINFYETSSEAVISRELAFSEGFTGEKINFNGGAFGLKAILTVSTTILALAIRIVFGILKNKKESTY